MHFLTERVNSLDFPMTIEMAKKARALAAQGHDVVNLSLGEPDFDTPSFVKEAGIEGIRNNHSHYTPVAGIPSLREAIVKKLADENGLSYTPNQIIVSTGAKQSIANAVLSLINPGDEAVVPAPYWVSYVDLVKFCGGTVVSPVGSMAQGFKITPEQLEQSLTEKTKLFIFSSPNNPSGAMYSRAELKGLAEVLQNHPHVFVLADEIYEYIRYTEEHVSFASFPGMMERTATINGLSKGFAMTGWRLGYMAAPVWLTDACEKIQSQFTSGPSSITQQAGLAALRARRKDVYYMLDAFASRRNQFAAALSAIPGLKVLSPQGAFYIFADITAFLHSKGPSNAEALSLHLLETAHVSSVPGDAFGMPGFIRWSFAANEADLQKAADRLRSSLLQLVHN